MDASYEKANNIRADSSRSRSSLCRVREKKDSVLHSGETKKRSKQKKKGDKMSAKVLSSLLVAARRDGVITVAEFAKWLREMKLCQM